MVYVEDQYFWGRDVARVFGEQLQARPELRVIIVVPLVPDLDGLNRMPQLLGRHRAIDRLTHVAPERVAAFALENHAGVPVYVHAKVCIIDDTWTSTGSDNFSRRSWTHDSELTAVVLDESYARDLRLTLAAEHLDRLDDVTERGLEKTMSDCVDPAAMFDVYAAHAAQLDDWHAAGRRSPRPPGRLRRLPPTRLTQPQRRWAALPLDLIHDPDGRPSALRGSDRY